MTIPSDEIRRELSPGERVLWSDKALGGLRLDASDLQKSAFGLVFFGFSIFWTHGAWSASSHSNSLEGTFFPLFGLPFLFVGFYLFVGHFFWSAFSRKYTEYAVTTRRVVVRSGIFSRKTQSIDYRKIPTLTMTEKSDGSGTIQFGETKVINQGEGTAFVATKIEAVADVRSVYSIIRKASDSELTVSKVMPALNA